MSDEALQVREAIELLLNRMNTRNQYVGGTFGGFLEGTTGNMSMFQREANAAIAAWSERHDARSLKQLAASLHAYGNLTDAEYGQIMKALDGDN